MSVLKVAGLTKRYGNFTALENLDLSVEAGEIFGCIGRNGAGKSTLIKAITGIHPFDEGNIEVCGFDVAKSPLEAKQNIGYVPDDHPMYEEMTGREYVNFIADCFKVGNERKEAAEELYKKFAAEEYADKRISGYSHGTKQKFSIIASLIHKPPLWILDEPLTGLDITMSLRLRKEMTDHAANGGTVFFSSHNLDVVAKICSRAAFIDKGKLLKVVDLKNNDTDLEKLFVELVGE